MKQIIITTPLQEKDAESLQIGDQILISGYIFTGRDAVLPKLAELVRSKGLDRLGIDLKGTVIFHTAVSSAGIGPTSSNKLDIESSIPDLSEAGVRIHIGKGKLNDRTIMMLQKYSSVYAITPPVSALLTSKVKEKQIAAFPEEGMEALHLLYVEEFPAIIAAAKGKTIWEA